jgi:hypothetical protein
MGSEIELYSKLQNPVAEIRELGKMVARSGMFGCEREEAGCAIVMMSWMDGMTLTQWARTYDLVEGKARKKALACLAEFRSVGGKHKWLSSGDTPTAKEDDRYAEIELTDREQNKLIYRYSMADARAEGLIKDKSRWVKRPGNMLRARCISNGLGMLVPEIFAGDDSDSDSSPSVAPLNLTSATTVSATAVATEPPKVTAAASAPVIDVESEKVEAEMGLAPATTKVTPHPAPPSSPAPSAPAIPFSGLPQETVEAIGNALAGNMLPAARWLIKEGWLPVAEPPADESAAGVCLTKHLHALSPARAKRILIQKESFLRAIKEAK